MITLSTNSRSQFQVNKQELRANFTSIDAIYIRASTVENSALNYQNDTCH